MHPWHDVEVGDQAPELVPVIIEVPQGSKNKDELDKGSGLLKVDRVLFSSVHSVPIQLDRWLQTMRLINKVRLFHDK